MENILKVFKTLSDGTRLRILNLLLRSGKPVCICEMVDALKLAQYNVSKHMKELKYAGLVMEHRDGKFIYYSLAPAHGALLAGIYGSLKTVPEKTLVEDKKRLCCRLLDRIEGKCCG